MNNKIPNLTEELLSNIKDALYREPSLSTEHCNGKGRYSADKKKMRALGFVELINYPDVWMNKKLGIVVKESYVASKKPRQSVPTIKLLKEKVESSGDYTWYAQPIVDRSPSAVDKAYLVLKKLACYHRSDFHMGNIGMYDGRAVMFDW